MGRIVQGFPYRNCISLALCALAVGFFTMMTPIGKLADLRAYDLVMSRSTDQSTAQVVVIYIDDYSLRQPQLSDAMIFWQPKFASVIELLHKAGARSVGIDYIFNAPEKHLTQEDRKKLPVTIMEMSSSGMPVVLGFEKDTPPPDNQLYLATKLNGALGYLDFPGDEDDFIRRFLPCITKEGVDYFAFGVELAAQSTQESPACQSGVLSLGEHRFYREADGSLLIYSLESVQRNHWFSFADVLMESEKGVEGQKKLHDMFNGKIVLIGAKDKYDVHAVPTSGRIPGVDIHAAITNMMLTGQSVATAPLWYGWTLTTLLILVSTYLFIRVPFLYAFGVLGIAVIIPSSVAVFAWHRGLWLSPVTAMIGAIAAFGGTAIYRYQTEYKDRIRTREYLGRYLSPELIRQMEESEGFDTQDRFEEVTVLVSDIRGFTTLSSQRPAHEIVLLLNEYLSLMTEIIMHHNGMVDKFIGDGILAVFIPTKTEKDTVWNAVKTAFAMQAGLRSLNEKRNNLKLPEFKIGIGIHHGPVMICNIGSKQRKEFTVIGDTVNTASRIQDYCKKYAKKIGLSLMVTIFVSDDVHRRLVLNNHNVRAEEYPRVTLAGKEDSLITLWRLQDTSPDFDGTLPL